MEVVHSIRKVPLLSVKADDRVEQVISGSSQIGKRIAIERLDGSPPHHVTHAVRAAAEERSRRTYLQIISIAKLINSTLNETESEPLRRILHSEV